MKTYSPKPNAPNTTAWTRDLDAPAPVVEKPKKAAKVNLWTAPLASILVKR